MKYNKVSKRRSFVKALSWRMVAFTILGLTSYAFTRSWEETSYITIVYNVVQIFIYFLHERLWERISWGRPRSPLPPARDLTDTERAAVDAHLRELGYIE